MSEDIQQLNLIYADSEDLQDELEWDTLLFIYATLN